MKYLMSDIHGEYQMFLKMLEQINFSDDDILYILGDVVDRGPEPIKILQYIMKRKNIILLRGNHEQMMLDGICLSKDKKEFISTINSRLWMRNGGFTTVDQFLNLPFEEQKEMYKYIKNTEFFKIVDNNLLVHAGVYLNKFDFETDEELETAMKKQNKDDLIWERDMVYNTEYFLDNYHIYIGHTPTLKLQDTNRIYKTKGFTLIDGGACFLPGTLICVCLDNKDVYYQER